MPLNLPHLVAFRSLSRDGWLLFATRGARLFAYGLFSWVLVLYLEAAGLAQEEIALLLLLTMLGDTAISLWLTTRADRLGRRRTLFYGALLMIFAGGVFALTNDFWLLLLAATVGVISPTGNEVGPFLPVEQAGLVQTIPADRRTEIFAWYNLVGSLTTAAGALCAGLLVALVRQLGSSGLESYRPLAVAYAGLGLVLVLLFTRVSPAVEVPGEHRPVAGPARLGLHTSLPVVLKLAALFALDAFGGGFIVQAIVAYWFYVRFQTPIALIGAIFAGANVLAGFSALAAAAVARRIGLLNTMVLTHLPSNVLLILVPLMPTEWLAILVLLLRFSISQMDVPTRQSYTMAVVCPEERSAAAGVTGVARSVGASISPSLATGLVANPTLLSVPFFLAGGLKILYDLLLYRAFSAVRPPEEESVTARPGPEGQSR
jgi:MFS family permease